ncbi:hypothetical protein [Sphingomonas sp. 28-63-12]|uniref:hypothetical protein n=1 Tax=Sphingomonas sp. 28-63-12 TaxID=1970434 RepID=UPI000BD1A4A7|nr:MAG: hypothetical protein B7Y47_08280 [Sphingomonas sp. 28-63-12]
MTGQAPNRNGLWAWIVGPGATRADTGLTIAAMVLAVPLAASAIIAAGPVGWHWWQWLFVLLLASDLGGGMIANALPATKRWYHRDRAQEPRMLAFAALHLHLPVLALIVPGAMPLGAALLGYIWLLGGVTALLAVPHRQRLAVALAFTALGTVLLGRLVPIDSALGWMPLALYLKILAGHLIGPDTA